MTDEPLPTRLTMTKAETEVIPSARVLDELARMGAPPFAELAQTYPGRMLAYRALVRDFPDRDRTSLWLHSYDCELRVVTDAESGPLENGQTPPLLSAITGTSIPET